MVAESYVEQQVFVLVEIGWRLLASGVELWMTVNQNL